eukprot:COSAG02_NODE_30_length_50867_cov_66.594331_18_plen_63_part_00
MVKFPWSSDMLWLLTPALAVHKLVSACSTLVQVFHQLVQAGGQERKGVQEVEAAEREADELL